jgi:penicillin-binding protein 1B
MRLWGDMLRRAEPQPLDLHRPEDVELAWVDRNTGKLSGPECADALELPFVRGTLPRQTAPCHGRAPGHGGIKQWLKDLFQ